MGGRVRGTGVGWGGVWGGVQVTSMAKWTCTFVGFNIFDVRPTFVLWVLQPILMILSLSQIQQV